MRRHSILRLLIACIIWLVLGAGWVRSHIAGDMLIRARQNSYLELCSADGRLVVGRA